MESGFLHRGLEDAADRFGDRIAMLVGEESLTFEMLERRATGFAAYLAQRGIESGSRVAVMCSNRPEFVVAVYAASKLGAASVLLNPAWRHREVEHALVLTEPSLAVGDGVAVDLLGDRLGTERVIDLDGGGLWSAGEVVLDGNRVGDVDQEVLLVFSSGTTGLPKAVRHTHRTMGWAVIHWLEALGLGPDDRFQVATPPSHILGLLNLATAIAAGACVRLHRRFDLDEVLTRIQSDRMTLEMAVAPIALALANHPNLESYDLSSLRYIMWGATPVTPSVAETVTRRTGVRWLPGYGASEVPVISVNPVNDPDSWRLDSPGLPPTGVELRVVDLETGGILPAGEVGEIQVRSPSMMVGYLPAESSIEVFDDGWYRTGDVGWLETTGWIHLTDRSKEMIKVNGFQVAPAELEAVLHGHPAVLDCAVFGIADERSGEVPVAAVQASPGYPGLEEELKELVSSSFASYKRLHDVVVVDTIPRLPSGKVLRRVLRQEWEPQLSDRTDA